MFRVEMLPAACGDCLWIEYGKPPATHVVVIDGGVKATAQVLAARIARARAERGVATLDIELLVVTHIDNDHIQGVVELLKRPDPDFRIKDIWFNGRPQLNRLPPLRATPKPAARNSDFLGRVGDRSTGRTTNAFLGPAEGDELSILLEKKNLPWNRHPIFNAAAVMVPEEGTLPSITLDGGLKLTLLGPTPNRLHELRVLWERARPGNEDSSTSPSSSFLGRADRWPPTWKDGEQSDQSVTNGSSIQLLAAFEGAEILLAGDAYAEDIAAGIERVQKERGLAAPLPLGAFKLSHHGSDKNLTRKILERIDCRRFLVSTDGSSHRHPDHLALLRVLRYSRSAPELWFNYASATTRRWGEAKADVLRGGFPGYEARFPSSASSGIVLDLDAAGVATP